LEQEPEHRFERILFDAKNAIVQARDDAEVMRRLRRMKADGALLIALADLGEVWPITHLIDAQTRLADAAVDSAVRYLLMDSRIRGKPKRAAPPAPPGAGGPSRPSSTLKPDWRARRSTRRCAPC